MSVRLPALAGAVVAGLITIIYVATIRAQDPLRLEEARVLFVAGLLAATSAVGIAGAFLGPHPARPALLLAAAIPLLATGILAILSIGLPILVAGVAILLSGIRALAAQPVSGRLVLASAAGSLAVVATGFALT